MNYIRNQDLLNDETIIKQIPGGNKSVFKHNSFEVINLPDKVELTEIKKSYTNAIFVNLAEDHLTYINDEPYTIRYEAEPNAVPRHLCHMSYKNLELNEEKLKREVVTEYGINKDLIVTDKDRRRGYITSPVNVKTPLQFFKDVKYYRMIFPFYGYGVDNTFLDDLLDLLSTNKAKHIIFMIFDDISAAAMIRNILVLYEQILDRKTQDLADMKDLSAYERLLFNIGYDLKLSVKHPLLKLGKEGDYKVVRNLVHILHNSEAKYELDRITCFSSDLRILILSEIADQASKRKISYFYVNLLLSRYLILLIITDYFLSSNKMQKRCKFSVFLTENYEYENLCRFLKNKKCCDSLIAPLNKLLDPASLSNSSMIQTTVLVKTSPKNYTVNKNSYNNRKQNNTKDTSPCHNDQSNNPAQSPYVVTSLDVPNGKNVVFINLREEPMIFINDELFVLRDYEQCNKNVTFLRFVSQKKLEKIENKLKRSAIEECHSTGQIKCYSYQAGDLQSHFISDVKDDDITTTKEYFTRLYKNASYIRRPVTSSVPFSFGMFDKIKQLITNNDLLSGKKDIFLYSQTYHGRSAYIAIIFGIINDADTEHSPTCLPPYHVFQLLIPLLPLGDKAHALVSHLYEKYFYCDLEQYLNKENDFKKIVRSLKKYFLLVCFASYTLNSRSVEKGSNNHDFDSNLLVKAADSNAANDSNPMSPKESQNINNTTAVQNLQAIINSESSTKYDIKENIDNNDQNQHGEDKESFRSWMLKQKDVIFQYNELSKISLDDIRSKKEITDKNIADRNGKILKSMMILKNDNFLGSKLFSEHVKVKGVRNLRFVTINEKKIIGLSTPTETGIGNIFRFRNKTNTAVWFCLREEPVAYINGFPYVLRSYHNPNSNIEITGVTTEKVEQMENDLKLDVAQNNEIYLHDEVLQRSMVKTIARHVKIVTLATPKETYTKHKIHYYRIPITDEQIPLPHIIDNIRDLILHNDSEDRFVFNCQVGRGRTTTGMVIAYLVLGNREKVYHKIRYRIISKLLQILPNGRASKQITDYAIDTMDHIINLRTVIEDFENSRYVIKRNNFLVRYAYLICFTEFLLQNKEKTFVEFLANRKEIQNLIATIDEVGLELI